MGVCKWSCATIEKSVDLEGVWADVALYQLNEELIYAQTTENSSLVNEIRNDIDATLESRGKIAFSAEFDQQWPVPTMTGNENHHDSASEATEGEVNQSQTARSSGIQPMKEALVPGPKNKLGGIEVQSGK